MLLPKYLLKEKLGSLETHSYELQFSFPMILIFSANAPQNINTGSQHFLQLLWGHLGTKDREQGRVLVDIELREGAFLL